MAHQLSPKTISASEASNNFGSLIDQAAKGLAYFIVTRMGQPRAVVLGFDQYLDLLDELEIKEEQDDPEFQALLKQAKTEAELGQTVTLEEFDEMFGFARQNPRSKPSK